MSYLTTQERLRKKYENALLLNPIATLIRQRLYTEKGLQTELYRPLPHYAPVSKQRNENEDRVDNFIEITVFRPPESRVGAFVYRNAGKVY